MQAFSAALRDHVGARQSLTRAHLNLTNIARQFLKKNQRVSLSPFTQYVNPSSRHNHAMSVFCSTLIDSFTVKIDVHKLQFIVKYSKVFTVKRRKRSLTKQSIPWFFNVGNEVSNGVQARQQGASARASATRRTRHARGAPKIIHFLRSQIVPLLLTVTTTPTK